MICETCGRHNPSNARWCANTDCGALLPWPDVDDNRGPTVPGARPSPARPGDRPTTSSGRAKDPGTGPSMRKIDDTGAMVSRRPPQTVEPTTPGKPVDPPKPTRPPLRYEFTRERQTPITVLPWRRRPQISRLPSPRPTGSTACGATSTGRRSPSSQAKRSL